MSNNSVKLTIKPYYRGEALNYTVGIVESLNLHVVQTIDTQGFIMGIPGKTDEKHPATAVFGITKEEFLLKDNDKAKLDDLVFSLMHELPRDRIIAESNLRKEGRAETIDNGRYAAEKIAELEERKKSVKSDSLERAKKRIDEMLKNESGWFIYTKGAGKIIPTVDSTGAALLFSKEEYAKALIENSKAEVELDVQRMNKNGISLFFQNLHRFGILSVKIDVGTADGGEASRDDIVNFNGFKDYALINSETTSYMIRYLQARQLKKEEDKNKSSAALWNAFARSFPVGVYLIPFCFDGEEGKEIPEKEVFFSERAVAVMKENKPVIIGIEEYKPANVSGRPMKAISVKRKTKESEDNYFPVFTDILEFRAAFGDKARPFFVSFEDIKEKYRSFDGVVINSASLFFAITKQGIENICEIMEKTSKN